MNTKKISYRQFKEEYDFENSDEIISQEEVYLIKNEKDKIIGYTQFKKELGVLFLDALYIKEKRKGYGKKIIRYLLEEDENIKKIIGFSLNTEEALGFWESLGADFKGDEEEEDVYFEIKKFDKIF